MYKRVTRGEKHHQPLVYCPPPSHMSSPNITPSTPFTLGVAKFYVMASDHIDQLSKLATTLPFLINSALKNAMTPLPRSVSGSCKKVDIL